VFTVRPITNADALRRCVDLQMQIWGMDAGGAVPDHQLVAAVSAGGLVLGGFSPDATLIGFSYAFPGWRRGKPLWYSHMTGVLAEHRDAGLGYHLKAAQREAALAAGIDHIVWTYDPLQAGNARFNLGRLGAVASRYHADYYGAMIDDINRGLPSDRFEVDWFLRSPRVVARLASTVRPPIGEDAVWAVTATEPDPSALPGRPHLDLRDARILVEIPRDLNDLKTAHPAAAAAWRETTRAAFQHYFARGYAATDAFTMPNPKCPRVAYLMERAAPDPERGSVDRGSEKGVSP
jgi:predicted GNAT superfamily acetyltransferase